MGPGNVHADLAGGELGAQGVNVKALTARESAVLAEQFLPIAQKLAVLAEIIFARGEIVALLNSGLALHLQIQGTFQRRGCALHVLGIAVNAFA